MNLMQVHLELKGYRGSLDYSRRAMRAYEKLMQESTSILDSIRLENHAASAILGKCQSDYFL